MGAMENQQTMAPPMKTTAAPFVPIQPEEPIISRSIDPNQLYPRSILVHPTQVISRSSPLLQMDGQSEQTSPAETHKPSLSQTNESSDCGTTKEEHQTTKDKQMSRQRLLMRRSMQKRRTPSVREIENIVEAPVEEIIEQKPEDDILIIDQLKQPEEMLPVQPTVEEQQERERLQAILREKTKRASILEAMLNIYENKHQCINNQLVCRHKQLEELVRAYTGADGVEIIAKPQSCGCLAQAPKLMNIESIFVTTGGKTYELKYAFNDAYADMLRHGISMKQVLG